MNVGCRGGCLREVGILLQRCFARHCRKYIGICSRGQRVAPVIAIQQYPNDSWVATWFARGYPVSRPSTTVGEIYKGIACRSNGGQDESISTY
jgi:hypothetical protein